MFATTLFGLLIGFLLWLVFVAITRHEKTRGREFVLREALQNARIQASKAEHACASLLTENATLKKQISDLTEILAELSSEVFESQNGLPHQEFPGKTVPPKILNFPISSKDALRLEIAEGM